MFHFLFVIFFSVHRVFEERSQLLRLFGIFFTFVVVKFSEQSSPLGLFGRIGYYSYNFFMFLVTMRNNMISFFVMFFCSSEHVRIRFKFKLG